MKKAVMYGAGNIGRGFIGQLFYESGYETTFIDVNMGLIGELNDKKEYPVYITKGDTYEKYIVKNVCGIDGKNIEKIAETIVSADVMATAVGVNILRYIAEPVAAGVKLMYETKRETPLNIIICENMIGADQYFATLVKGYLSEEVGAYFDTHIGLVEPSIGRMVPVTPKQFSQENPLAVCVEEYCELPVDQNGFKGEIPAIAHMIPCKNFEFYIRRKLFMHNMSHALCAYMGFLKGYRYIWEAAEDPAIRKLASGALREISEAMAKEFRIPLSELDAVSEDLLSRFTNRLLGDTIERVGRDTKRKLAENDRFVGAALLCQRHGILPHWICTGIAAGLMFGPDGDSLSAEVVKSIRSFGLNSTLASVCGIDAASELAMEIRLSYERLSAGATPDELLSR